MADLDEEIEREEFALSVDWGRSYDKLTELKRRNEMAKVPWITTNQADKLWLAAKKIQAELSELDGVDLLPEHKPLTKAMAKLDEILNEIENSAR